jgi:hypothetical protein
VGDTLLTVGGLWLTACEKQRSHYQGLRGSHMNVDYDATSAAVGLAAMRAIYLALHDHPKPAVREVVQQNAVTIGRIGIGEPRPLPD